jgi:hypothetical protein
MSIATDASTPYGAYQAALERVLMASRPAPEVPTFEVLDVACGDVRAFSHELLA